MSELLDYFAEGELQPEEVTEEGETKQVFRVQTDDQANWALAKLQRFQREKARIEAQAQEAEWKIKEWKQSSLLTVENEIRFFEGLLIAYHRWLEAQDVAGKSYKLPLGTLKSTKQTTIIEVQDKEGLIAWAEENAPELIKTEKSVKQAELNKLLKETKEKQNGKEVTVKADVVTDKGEIVPGVRAEIRPDKNSVSVNELKYETE